jgi:hypothetical protein
MTDFFTFDGVLWAVAAALTVWAFVPPLVTALGLYRSYGTAAEDPRAVEPAGDDPEYAQKYRELLALGFRPVGVLTEHYRLFAFHWYKAAPAHCLATEGGLCHAALYRFFAGPLRVRFDAFLDDGFLVRTVMGEEWTDRDDQWGRVEIPATSVVEVYEQHRLQVEAAGGVRGASPTGATFRRLAEFDEAQNKERVQKVSGLWVFLAVTAIFFLAPALISLLGIWLLFGTGALARGAAISLCLGAGFYFVFLKVLVPLAARGQFALNLADAPAEPDAGP